ncbi:hypothetical protein ACHHYP_05277 [Achlya hypogyna]|uniref:C2 domain-containing protein n=1 Tax=Achlya hypogyna TaxID=1202772 RepID=A0A1V9YYP2_ACHHY|nr:hypothetical protein ACHHYP_05277 [Achlya hypogyna]
MGPSTQHTTFAALFRLNDPLFLQDLLDEDVILHTHDGRTVMGATNVLAYLVGPRMTQWSQLVATIGPITVVAPNTTKTRYITEKGHVKDVLFEEKIEWTADLLVHSIAHVSSQPHRPRSLPGRLSAATLLDESIDSLVDTFVSSSSSSVSSPKRDPLAPCIFELSHASVTDLSPVKPQRAINAYLLVKEYPSGAVLHRSVVVKNQRAPQWPTPIRLECSPRFRRLDISVVHTSLVYTKVLGSVCIDASVLPAKPREQYDFMGSIVPDPECAPDLNITFHRYGDGEPPTKAFYSPEDLLPSACGLAAAAAEPATMPEGCSESDDNSLLLQHILHAVSLSLLCVLGMVIVEYATITEAS